MAISPKSTSSLLLSPVSCFSVGGGGVVDRRFGLKMGSEGTTISPSNHFVSPLTSASNLNVLNHRMKFVLPLNMMGLVVR